MNLMRGVLVSEYAQPTRPAGLPEADSPPHVLVVDDDPGIRGFLQAILQAEGYSVSTANDGREALARIAEREPHLLLLDLSMPVMNGWEVHDRLRAMSSHIPVVFMTAGLSARVEAEARGVAGYLAKPFEVDEMLRIVDALVTVPAD